MTVLAHPLDRISRRARPYPAHLLPVGGTGLSVFSAAFLGHNDAIHMARQDMTGTCVDTDAGRLLQMAELYPDSWDFHVADAWEFADQAAEHERVWDAVSVDPFTGREGDKALESLEAWCCVARRLVTVTIKAGQDPKIPSGWDSYLFPRAGDVYWLVMTR